MGMVIVPQGMYVSTVQLHMQGLSTGQHALQGTRMPAPSHRLEESRTSSQRGWPQAPMNAAVMQPGSLLNPPVSAQRSLRPLLFAAGHGAGDASNAERDASPARGCAGSDGQSQSPAGPCCTASLDGHVMLSTTLLQPTGSRQQAHRQCGLQIQDTMRMFQSMPPEQQAQVQREAQSMQNRGFPAAAGPLQALQNLKNEGNSLHSSGQYAAACDKYEEAIRGAQGMPHWEAMLCCMPANIALGSYIILPAGQSTPDSVALVRACKLNLSSCYLNQGKHQACVTVCSEILAQEPSNRKALYRR